MRFQPSAFLDRLGFATDLAQARHRIDGGQAGLAKALSREAGEEIGQSGLSKWLKAGGNRPSLEHIAALARLAGVDPGWLAMGELSQAPVPEAFLPSAPESIVEAEYRDGLRDREAEQRREEELEEVAFAAAHPRRTRRRAAKEDIDVTPRGGKPPTSKRKRA